MKTRTLFRSLPLLLALLLLFACKPTEGPAADSETVPQTEDRTNFTLTNDFLIIRSEYSTEAVEAARYVRDGLNELFGLSLELATDFVRRGEEVVPAAHEILVGKTNRPAVQELYGSLRAKDWAYSVVDDGCIVITGGNEDSCLEAAKAFMKDQFGYTGSGTGAKRELSAGTAENHLFDYPVKTLTLNGSPFSDWSIVYDNTTWADLAAGLSLSLSDPSGEELPVALKTSSAPRRIRLKAPEDKSGSAYAIRVFPDGSDIVLEATNADTMKLAIDAFLGSLLPEKYTKELDLKAEEPFETYTFASREINQKNPATGETFRYENGLRLVSQSESPVCDGVKQMKLEYTDYEGKPVVAYLLICEPGTVTPVLGIPDAGDSLIGVKQNPMRQAQAAENAYGYDICAAINGDLYLSATEPASCPYHNGVRLSQTSGCFFAVKKDGSFYIGYDTDREIDLSEIQEAVGGRYLILKNGDFADVNPGDNLIYYRHPRSAVGYDDEGRIFLLVVDGRQAGYSNGVSIPDMGIMLRPFGVTNAINLDGGGSSVLVVKDYEKNEFTYPNSPSDGSMRAVIDSLLLVRNPEYGK